MGYYGFVNVGKFVLVLYSGRGYGESEVVGVVGKFILVLCKGGVTGGIMGL